MRNLVRKISAVTKLAYALRIVSAALVLTLAVITITYATDAFAPAGTKATLSVDYVYESAGKKSSEGMYDPYQWRVKRSANLVAELVAQPATAMPTVQAIDAGQMAGLESLSGQAQSVATQMAPMIADVEKIMAACGEDEACITRAAMKMGAALQGTPEMDAAMNARNAAQELGKPGAPRYQAWRPTAQKGSYRIDENVHISVTDPICTSLPGHRCTRDEVRMGAGEIPQPPDAQKNPGAAAGVSAAEVDTNKNTLTVALPVPLFLLPYTETITTDEPEGTHDTPTPTGAQQKLLRFRVNAAGDVTHDQPFTVALDGSWRNQTGQQVVALQGEFGDAGNLTISWRFAVQ